MTTPAEQPPPWLPIAEKYLGFHETGNNLGIEHFIQIAHTGSLGDPWCAIFVNACLEEAGFRGSRSAAARSFEHDANFTKLTEPRLGCIVTRWRGSPSSGLGHVYFFLGQDANGIHAIAGNEDDAVREYYEPPDKVTGFWWPQTALGASAPAGILFQATGKMSIFGGPSDTGSGNPQEGLAIYSSEAQMIEHGVGDLILPPNGFGLFRRLNPDKFYIACRWDYNETPLSFLRGAQAAVSAGDKSAWARPVDWGPNIRTGRIADLSPGLARFLGLQTDDVCSVTVSSAAKIDLPPLTPEPPVTVPVPPTPSLPVPTLPSQPGGQFNPADLTDFLKTATEFLKQKGGLSSPPPTPPPAPQGANMTAGLITFLTWFISVLPQVSVLLAPVFQALVSGGVVGPAIGSGATPTGTTIGATLLSTFGVGILNWVKTKLFTPPPAPTPPPTNGSTS